MSMISAQCDQLRERAKELRQGRWSDGADDAKLMEDAADTILSLRDRAQGLQAENARLRGARDVWQENDAKLRELVRDMRTCIDHACMCEFCPLFVTEEDMGERRCIADMKAHMRELGIEVDE